MATWSNTSPRLPSRACSSSALPHGPARAHLHPAGDARGALVLGHGAGGGVGAPDLVLATEVANGLGIVVVLVEQPYRVAGRRSTPTPHLLDQAWVPVVEQLRAGPLAGLPVVTGGRSSGARGGQRPCRSCRIATATMLELAPIWVHWHDAGARQLPMCVRGSPYGTLRSMPLVADWR